LSGGKSEEEERKVSISIFVLSASEMRTTGKTMISLAILFFLQAVERRRSRGRPADGFSREKKAGKKLF
jgi:hypothetical protein